MDWRIYIATLIAIAALVLGLVFATGDADSPDVQTEQSTVQVERLRDPERGDFPPELGEGRSTVRTTTGTTRHRPSGERDALQGGERAEAPETVVLRAPARSSEDVDTVEEQERVRDMGGADAGWSDPTNQRVLGAKEWMAPVSDAEREKIDEIFERSRELRDEPGLSRLDRLAAIAAARVVTDACYRALQERRPGMRGRLIVRWTSGADENGGWAEAAEIPVNHKLQDAEFSACVIDGVNRMRFPAAPAEAVAVEYPFFYDGSF